MQCGPKPKRSARKRAWERIGKIYLPAAVGLAAVVAVAVVIVRSAESAAQATENLSILGGVLVALAIITYLSPGTQEWLKQRARARQDEQERQFWARRDENDRRQAEAQARVEAERLRRNEERLRQEQAQRQRANQSQEQQQRQSREP